jgi:WD40 repeat protein
VETGAQAAVISDQPVGAFDVSRNARSVAHVTHEGAIAIVDAATWQPLQKIEAPEGGAGQLVFHPAGRHLAGAGGDGLVRIWETATGKLAATLPGTGESVWRLAFTADGQRLIVMSGEGQVRVFGAK